MENFIEFNLDNLFRKKNLHNFNPERIKISFW